MRRMRLIESCTIYRCAALSLRVSVCVSHVAGLLPRDDTHHTKEAIKLIRSTQTNIRRIFFFGVCMKEKNNTLFEFNSCCLKVRTQLNAYMFRWRVRLYSCNNLVELLFVDSGRWNSTQNKFRSSEEVARKRQRDEERLEKSRTANAAWMNKKQNEFVDRMETIEICARWQ